MNKRMGKTEIEKRITFLEEWLSTPISCKRTWSKIISEYHALNIKLVRMEGQRLIANEFQPDHII